MAWINIFEEFQPWLISMHVLCLHLRALSRCPACPAGRNCEPAPSSTRCMKGCSAMAFRLRVRERIQKILMKTTRALEDKVFFIWFAVCVSADVSTAQAACMLAAENPWEVFCRHEESFDDPDFCGIRPEDYAVSQDDRNQVWRNARVFRKAGGTQVPLGIFRKPDGSFVPLFGDDTLSEIKHKIGL